MSVSNTFLLEFAILRLIESRLQVLKAGGDIMEYFVFVEVLAFLHRLRIRFNKKVCLDLDSWEY